MAVDFRKILIAYIRHIRAMEGGAYIGDKPEGLSDEEYEALLAAALEDDAYHERAAGELADLVSDMRPDETPLMAMLRLGR